MIPYKCLFHVIELHKIWENPNETAIFGKIITNEHIFFKKLIDSNLPSIAVGRPNPEQCFGKSTLKSK